MCIWSRCWSPLLSWFDPAVYSCSAIIFANLPCLSGDPPPRGWGLIANLLLAPRGGESPLLSALRWTLYEFFYFNFMFVWFTYADLCFISFCFWFSFVLILSKYSLDFPLTWLTLSWFGMKIPWFFIFAKFSFDDRAFKDFIDDFTKLLRLSVLPSPSWFYPLRCFTASSLSDT